MFTKRFPIQQWGVAASEILLLLMLGSGRPGVAAGLTLKVVPEAERTNPEHYILRVALECHRAVRPASLQWTMEYSSSSVTITQVSMSPTAQRVAKNVYCHNSGGRSTCLLFGLNHESLTCGPLATLELRVDPKPVDPVQFKITGAVASSSDGSARPLKTDRRAISFAP